jgi:hypothetical protein
VPVGMLFRSHGASIPSAWLSAPQSQRAAHASWRALRFAWS